MPAKTPSAEAELEAASDALSAAMGRVAELENRKGAINGALAINAGRLSAEPSPGEAEVVTKRREAALEVVRTGRRDHRLQADLEDIEDELLEARAAVATAREARDKAQGRVRTQLAQSLQPRHREVVQELASLLNQVGVLAAEEADLRAQVGNHLLLPSAAIHGLGLPTNYNSNLSMWFRRVKDLGFLDGLRAA